MLSKPTRRGFSLIELLIALLVFCVALSVSLGVLRQSISRLEKLQTEIFTILRVQYYDAASLTEAKLNWLGPMLQCEMQKHHAESYVNLNSVCKRSNTDQQFSKIIPKEYIDWGEF